MNLIWADDGFYNLFNVNKGEELNFQKVLNWSDDIFEKLKPIDEFHFFNKYYNPDNTTKLFYTFIKKNSNGIFDCIILPVVDLEINFKDTIIDDKKYLEVNNSFSTVIKIKKDLTVTKANDSFYKLLKYSKESLLEKYQNNLKQMFSTADYNKIIRCINETILNKNIRYCEMQVLDGNLNQLPVFLLINPFDIETSNELSLIILYNTQVVNDDIARYGNSPGYITKFLIGERVKLLFANDNFFNFFGIDYEKANRYLFPPVCHEDVRLVHVNINKMRDKTPVSFEVRVKNGNKNICWMRIDGNCIGKQGELPIYLILFSDITEQKQMEFDLQAKHLRIKLGANEIKPNFFEYDIIRDIYIGKSFFKDSLVYTENVETINNYLSKNKNHFVSNEYKIWYEFLKGIKIEPFEFSVSNDEKALYYKVVGNASYDGYKPIKIIGKFIDITPKKEKELEIVEKMNFDSITGLYNKSHGEYLIKQKLNQTNADSHLLIIDIDNFKKVNENFGYMFGNVILSDFGKILLEEITKDDIVYRYAGDNFVIFLYNKNLEYSTKISNNVCNKIKSLYLGDDENFKLTCSIGISFLRSKFHFDEAFCSAFKIVKKIKNSGIGVYAYNDDENEYYDVDLSKITYEDNDFKKEDNILLFALDILEKSHNTSSAINILMKRIAELFDLYSIYILDVIMEESKIRLKYWLNKDNFILPVFNEMFLNKDFLLPFVSQYNLTEMVDITTEKYEEFFKAANITYKIPEKVSFSCSSFDSNNDIQIILFTPIANNTGLKKQDKLILYKLAKVMFAYIKRFDIENLNKERAFILSKVSHEIKTPLNSILLMNKMFMDSHFDKKELSNYVNQVDSSSKYLLSLVNNILDFSRIELGKIKLDEEKVDLNELLESLESLMKYQAQEKLINLKFIKIFKHKFILTDQMRLNQVLINIIGNGLKFTSKQGHVTVIVEEVMDEGDYVTMKFSIKDNGIGINKENLHRIFLPFEQESSKTAKIFVGTGLGLAISYSLVKMMGGTLQVESRVNKGSEFFFSIPFIKVNTDNIEKNQVIIDYTKFVGKRILLVEDNELNANITKSILENMGLIVDVASDGASAIKKYNEAKTDFYQVILMDIRMPGIDGISATKIIRNLGKPNSKTIPIIAMTANTFLDEDKEVLKLGMNSYLAKPIDITKLYLELSKYI